MKRIWRWLVGGVEESWNERIKTLQPTRKERLKLPPIRPLKAIKQNVRDFPQTGTR